ncbi:LytR cell envelope-related transcriptional attenuator [Brevibacterium sanguinis]|uniref:LytR cell envelope-related transcriptional attenuator n=2 Tax=Brevibacterium TaxID=1696 RepID=A0A366IJ84_9MICO|nr:MULTISPECIES: LytR C-terminal domain-containing protein [Brevibacterium]RBP65535.1 LytR cell envelope-related transcriptional attenuator [Brevibacterium sanguinis]RBP72169.1 LytR cell envelope-related transcriptional attenuator [Brevibacterium celere]
MNDDLDDVQPGRRSGAHRQEATARSNMGAIALVIVIALVAVLLVVAAINIITSSMRDPESNVAEPAPTTSSAPATPTPTESEVSVVDSSLEVDVLNASGVSGAAKKFSEAVEKKGWKLGTVGNHSTSRSDSVVYYAEESNAAQAKLVADSLGIEATEQSGDFTSDLTVVICSDIARRGPEPAAGAPSESSSQDTGETSGLGEQ